AAYLARPAGAGEAAGWLGLLAQAPAGPGQPSPDSLFRGAVLSSPEYLARAGNTTQGWVAGLYGNVLNRAPDAAGFAGAVNQVLLNYEPQRTAVATALVNSDEYRTNLIAGYYRSFLGRA